MSEQINENINRVKELMGITNNVKPVNEGHSNSYMAKSQLFNIASKAQSMYDRLEKDEQLDDWMESKIAQMADNIDSVVNSFTHDEFEEKTMPCETTELEEDIMSGVQSGYPDTDGASSYTFKSKGALGSEPELEDEGFTEPETNYSKKDSAYNFSSDGPQDSYMDSGDDYGLELSYELGEQEGTESGESDDGGGAGTASMGVWDSGIARGVANQVSNSKWSDSYQPTRGKANPLY
ncbi:MAG: hypothetical protein HN793_15425 [Rhodospirillaceae bacterium]|nr:hypothetical protein [Rhodospirillaceae bacterium]